MLHSVALFGHMTYVTFKTVRKASFSVSSPFCQDEPFIECTRGHGGSPEVVRSLSFDAGSSTDLEVLG